jgi:3-deoxy-D-manno-octulosonic-acid transferase
MIGLYERITGAAYGVTRPLFEIWSRLEGAGGMWSGRLGHIPEDIAALGPQDLWLQAVSVGEVGVAEALVHALDRKAPGLKILVTATTPAGLARAISSLGTRCSVIPYPLDFPQVVRRMVEAVRPRVYACLETELWPNLIRTARHFGSRTVLINGRISAKSFPRYMRIRFLTQPLLAGFSKVCAISQVHADRLAALGAPLETICVTGNAKFEGLLSRPDPVRVAGLRRRLDIGEAQRVFVAGSVRGGEETAVTAACDGLWSLWPELVCFLVPRHTKGVPSWEAALKQKGIPFQLWSKMEVGERRFAKAIVVDVVGPLFDLYGLATAAFVGGSLVPKGGQNLMEPAAWSCPVIHGPYTDNFDEARSMLEEHGGCRQVSDVKGLVRAVDSLLRDSGERELIGTAARNALVDLAQGSATRQADILLNVLCGRPGCG